VLFNRAAALTPALSTGTSTPTGATRAARRAGRWASVVEEPVALWPSRHTREGAKLLIPERQGLDRQAPTEVARGGVSAVANDAMRIGPAVSTICDHIHRHEAEAGVRRILGVLSLEKKHGPAVIEDAAKVAGRSRRAHLSLLRRYLERRAPVPLTLNQVDPLIRQLTLYRDVIDRTGDAQ
jgi:hypothetical protein